MVVDDTTMAALASLRTCHLPLHAMLKYLRQKIPLFGFAIFSITLIVASEYLSRISNARQGLTHVDGTYYYLWTYGPALAFTVATAFWNKLVYRAQRGIPWVLLEKPVSGEVLFLDYITPLNIVSLYRSLKHRHLPVALTILGDFVFRLLIVFSSGLFRAELVAVTTDVRLVTLDRFDQEKLGVITTAVADLSLTLWTERQDRKRPLWLTDRGNAIQSFVASDKPDATLISANVSVFEVTQDCQAFDWILPLSKDGVQLESWAMSEFVPQRDMNVLDKFCPGIRQRFEFDRHDFDTPDLHKLMAVDICGSPDSYRIFAVSLFGLDANNDTKNRISAVLCLPSYSVKTRRVTTSWAGSTPGEIKTVDYTTEIGVVDLGLKSTQITLTILDSLVPYFPPGGKNRFGRLTTRLWTMMNYTMGWGVGAIDRPWNGTYLKMAFQQTFQNVAVHVAKTSGMATVNSTILGENEANTLRLRVQAVPLRAMQTLLGILVLLLAFLARNDNKFVFQAKETPTLLDIATLLSKNPQLSDLFGSGDHLQRRLLDHNFLATQGTIIVSAQATESRYGKFTSYKGKKLWRPLGRTVPYQTLIVFASLAVVATLEGSYQYSTSHNGVADVSLEDRSKYWWSLVPTLAMVLLGMAYTTISFGVLILHQYEELQRRRPNNMEIMEYDPLGRLAMAALPHAVMSRYFAVAAVLIVPLLTPFLSAASSGLYTAQETNQTRALQLRANGWFDLGASWKLDDKLPEPNSMDNLTYHIFNEAVQYNNLSISFSDDETVLVRPPPSCKAYPDSSNKTTTAAVNLRLLRELTSSSRRYPTIMPAQGQVFGFVAIAQTENPDTDESLSLYGNNSKIQPSASIICHDGMQHQFLVYGKSNNTSAKFGRKFDPCVVLHCLPYIDAMHVQVGLRLRVTPDNIDVEIDPQAPSPHAVPSPSPQLWNANDRPASAIPFPYSSNHASKKSFHDGFFTALTAGYQGIPAATLFQSSPSAINFTMQRIQHLYAQWTAQALNFEYRAPLNSTKMNSSISSVALATAPISATAVLPRRDSSGYYWLHQNGPSTRFLQGLLAALALCCAASLFLAGSQIPKLVHNPGTPAERMRLLAGGKLLEQLRSIDMSDVRGMRVRIKGTGFALGWWARESHKGGNDDGWYGIDVMDEDSSSSEKRVARG